MRGIGRWSFLIALCSVVTTYLAVRLARIPFRFEIDTNEGGNLFYSSHLMQGRSPYGPPTSLNVADYPPLAFLVPGLIGRLAGDPLLGGRALSIVALLTAACALWLAVRRLGCARYAATTSTLMYVGLFVSWGGDYVGINDPQLYGQALVAGALWLYLVAGQRRWATFPIALLCVAALFDKPNLCAAPMAMLIDSFLTSKRRAAALGLNLVILTGAAVGLSVAVFGPDSVADWFLPRTFGTAWLTHLNNLLTMGLAGGAFVTWWKLKPRPRPIVGWYLLTSYVVGTTTLAGAGTSVNMLFELYFAASLVVGLAIDQFLLQGRLSTRRLALLLAPLAAAIPLVVAHPPFFEDYQAQQQAFLGDVAVVSRDAGPTLCDSRMMCFYAHKDLVYDSFRAGQLLATGAIPKDSVLALLSAGCFQTVQLGRLMPPEWLPETSDDRYPDYWLEALFAHYQLTASSPSASFYSPKEPAAQGPPCAGAAGEQAP